MIYSRFLLVLLGFHTLNLQTYLGDFCFIVSPLTKIFCHYNHHFHKHYYHAYYIIVAILVLVTAKPPTSTHSFIKIFLVLSQKTACHCVLLFSWLKTAPCEVSARHSLFRSACVFLFTSRRSSTQLFFFFPSIIF